MNIKEATEQIRGAIRAYLSKDAHGLPRIPFHMQRPIIMFGPPGLGKTAVVSQIADEMGVNFVSYSITHHTRQSALGLPFIEQEQFGGRDFSISEYTMSEIIAAVHRARRASGVDEGILFLDEVNCVSETLAPAMLQFLQYKTFGMHQLPEGWVIVTAGNPPEYNRAAREFDPAMMDRLKRIDVEPNLAVWQEYAAAHGVHPAVTTFLEAKPASFYKVQASAKGTRLVTARGWEDLSRMLQAYEAEDIVANEALIRQYLQDDATAREFAAYYELFRKYQDDYKVSGILDGEDVSVPAERAALARFDERVALVGLILDALSARVHDAVELKEACVAARGDLVALKPALAGVTPEAAAQLLHERANEVRDASTVGARVAGDAGNADVVRAERIRILRGCGNACATSDGLADAFDTAKQSFNAKVQEQRALAARGVASVDNAFRFLDTAFGDGSQEAVILVTKLSADPQLIKLVGEHGSAEYLSHSKSLLFTERGLDLRAQIEELNEELTAEL